MLNPWVVHIRQHIWAVHLLRTIASFIYEEASADGCFVARQGAPIAQQNLAIYLSRTYVV